MAKETFEREYELEGGIGVLEFTQQGEGDVHCVVWDAALVLAKYLEMRSLRDDNFLKNKKVIELGAGLGCVGLVAATLGGNVTLTDQIKALPLLNENVKKNERLIAKLGGSVTTRALDWVADKDTEHCDLLLLADCVYYSESIKPLIDTLNRLSTAETEIILSQEDRSYSEVQSAVWKHFYNKAQELFSIRKIDRLEQHSQFSSDDIMLLRLKKLEK